MIKNRGKKCRETVPFSTADVVVEQRPERLVLVLFAQVKCAGQLVGTAVPGATTGEFTTPLFCFCGFSFMYFMMQPFFKHHLPHTTTQDVYAVSIYGAMYVT